MGRDLFGRRSLVVAGQVLNNINKNMDNNNNMDNINNLNNNNSTKSNNKEIDNNYNLDNENNYNKDILSNIQSGSKDRGITGFLLIISSVTLDEIQVRVHKLFYSLLARNII